MGAEGMKGESKYKKTMPEQLIKMFSEGKDREDFCADHSIAGRTFDLWLEKYPEFADAYEIAKLKAKQWFNNLARKHLVNTFEGDKLDSKLWSMMMRNRFELTEHRKLKIEGLKQAKNFADQMSQIMNELASGNLTGSEAAQLAKLVETGVKVYENTIMEKRLSDVEKANRTGASDSEFKEETNGDADSDTESSL
jgi:hypothetical protein